MSTSPHWHPGEIMPSVGGASTGVPAGRELRVGWWAGPVATEIGHCGGKGGQARAGAAPKAVWPLPSASRRPTGRWGESMGGNDYLEQELSPDELADF